MTGEAIKLTGGEGGNAFSFDHVGAGVHGKIIAHEQVQQTDMQSGQPAFWPDGRPKMMDKITLQTSLRDDQYDDGARSVYLRGSVKPESKSSLAAVLEAVRKSSAGNLAIGGTLALQYVGDGQPSRVGFNAPKQYEASYEPPRVELAGAPQQQPANGYPPPQQPPVQQQPPSPSAPDLVGWLKGQPIDGAMLAAMQLAGVDPRTSPDFQSADQPPF
jgi:hypothetical protein